MIWGMGQRGPKPTPTALLRRRGSKEVAARKNEPKPAPGAPVCPKHLKGEARAVWNRLVPDLDAVGMLSRVDAGALERYCVMFVRWRECEAVIRADGPVMSMKTENGSDYHQQRPEVGMASKLHGHLKDLETAFGLTPSARARLEVPQSDGTDAGSKVARLVS